MKTNLLLPIFTFLTITSTYSQIAPKIKDKDTAQRVRMDAAFCYRMANEYDKAIKAYDKVLKKDPKNTEALYQAGTLKMKTADGNADALREARAYFKRYLEEVPNDERVLNKVAAIDSVESWREGATKNRFKVSNVKALNTKANDYCPMIASKKDDKIYFPAKSLDKLMFSFFFYHNCKRTIQFPKPKRIACPIVFLQYSFSHT